MTGIHTLEGHTDPRLLQQLLNDFQQRFPLSPTPYADMAAQLGIDEATLLDTLKQLQDDGTISRIGAVFRVHRIGVSTLAAMAVPEPRLQTVADMISAYPSVNHNYRREHHFNLWFVVTAETQTLLDSILHDMEQRSGLRVLSLPMEKDYHIDLGFPLQLVKGDKRD
jgi:DNA-binding Lrp family transcriptional regulator